MTSRSSNTPATPVSNPASAQGVPDGWRLAPVEPTPEMIAAFWRQKNTGTQELGSWGDETSDYDAYRAMLSASPAPSRGAAVPASGGVEKISTHQVWLERVADRALQLGRRPTRAEILMCASDWDALAKPASEPAGGGVRVAAIESIAAWLERQRSEVPAHGWEFAAALRASGPDVAALSSAPATPSPAEAEAKEGRS